MLSPIRRNAGQRGLRARPPSASSTSPSRVSDAVAILDELQAVEPRRQGRSGRLRWGGGFVNRLAVAAGRELSRRGRLITAAPRSFRSAQAPCADASYNAGLDDRVNATSFPWVNALRSAGKTVEFFLYDGVESRLQQRHLGRALQQQPAAEPPRGSRNPPAFFRQHLGDPIPAVDRHRAPRIQPRHRRGRSRALRTSNQ